MKLTREQTGWELTRIWLDALEETARDFYGRPKEFCMRAYEYATSNWLRVLEEEYGVFIPKAKTIKEAIETYIKIGVENFLFNDASNILIDEINPYRVELKILSCPYNYSCQDLLEKGISIKNLTCARIGCFWAAIKVLAGIDCNYEVSGIMLEEGCQGLIEKK